MIPNQWYVILESNEVKRGKPVGVTRLSEKLVAWRDARGQVTVMRDLCPHRGVALSAGKLIGDCIECPFHGFRYDTTGACKLVPANGRTAAPPKALRAHAYSTREAHGFICIWWGEPKNDLPPLPGLTTMPKADFRRRPCAITGRRIIRAPSRTNSTWHICHLFTRRRLGAAIKRS